MQTVEKTEQKASTGKPKIFRTPLGITGIILMVIALLLGGLALVLQAEPTHAFYLILCTALGFLAINPLLINLRYRLLWQLMVIVAGIAAIAWLLVK